MKTRDSFLKLTLIIATVTMMVLLTSQFATGQPWYNPGWQYRRAVTVPNTGATLTDYQVKITLISSTFTFGNAKADGIDIRLTASDGVTLIPFWIEEWTSSTATIWVKVPSIPTGGTSVYLYYGNASATSTSNGSTTFSFFDDFESWNSTPSGGPAPLPTASADITMAVYNGKLYSFGGYGSSSGNYLNTVYEYDPATNVWTGKTSMPTARWGMVAVEFNGKIYVFGGQGTVNYKNEVYDPVNNTWETKTNIPAGLAQQGLMGVKFGDRIHLFYQSSHYEYDPATDSYLAKANVPTPRTWSTVGVVNNMIYVIGGYSYGSPSGATNVNEMYDPLTNIWTTKAPLPIPMWGATRENPVINGKIYVTHGHNGSVFFTTNYVYDPATNTWEQKGPAAHPRDGVGCGVISNKLYVVGGRDVVNGPYGLTWNEVYDPALDTWWTQQPQPGPSQWTTSGTSNVFADGSAKYQGNYGLVIRQTTDVGSQVFAQSMTGFGTIYALDFNWQITDIGGIYYNPNGIIKPQSLITLSEGTQAPLFFYNFSGTPTVRWYSGVFNSLVTSTWNSWHKATVVRNGTSSSSVIFDGISYSSLGAPPSGGTGKIQFGVYWATTQYIDNVRIRKWAGADPTTVVLVEQTQCPPAAPIVSSPVTYCVGATATPLTATGSNLLWYTAPTGGTGSSTAPIPSTDTQGATSYYVSQTVNGCEGPRAQIDVVVNPNPEIPTADVTQPICSLPTGTITVTSSIQGLSFSIDGSNYSNISGIFSSLIPGIYYLTARNSSNCISPAATVVVNPVTGTPDAPTANVTQPNCNTPTGTIIITAPTGAGMTYSKDGSDYTNNTGTFTGVAPGTYSLTAKTIQGCISAATIIVLNTPPGNNLGTWFDANWPYRRAVSVANSSGTTLTNYQVLITLNSSFDFTRAKNDGSDIRIAGSDGTTLIPFWIESWDAGLNQANIWVNVPSIPISGTSIFLYYGNNTATSAGNGSSTFEFFDDFESWTSPTNAWTEKQILPTPKADHTCAVYNGKLYAIGGYNLTAGDARGENYEYDPVTNSWAIKTPMPTPRWGPVAVEFNGKIYVFGGQLSNGAGTAKNEMYDPVNDTWSGSAMGNPLLIPDYGASGVVHPDVIYFPEGKDGYKYWMTYTPYPPQPDENPSVVRSNDGITWTGNGITNPVIPEGTPGSWNDLENPDPDFIYVAAPIDKWFLVWNGGDEVTNSRKIALAYSSDGKTWTQYDGSTVNGNTNPVILSGTDTQGLPWERGGGYSKTSCPTLLYENGTFYLYYVEEASGNNNGYAGFATFTWDNDNNNVVNLQRYAGNPTITKRGGHINLSKNPNNGNYYMHHVVGTNLELMTSADLINWTNSGTVLLPGTAGQWDGSLIYRSCPVVDKNGSIVFFEGNTRIYYSANGSIPFGIGMADILPNGTVQKFQSGGGLNDMPSSLGAQGLMGVKYGDKIHLFYKHAHYEYDPLYDTYTLKADLPTGRTWSTCAVVGNKIYVIGGYSYDNPCCATNVNEIYDPATNTWSTGAPMPVSKYGITRENPVINGKIYVTHGLDGGFHVDNYVYDPVANTWQQKQPATDLRDGTGCGVIDNKLYVTGGRADYAGPYGTSFNEVYDPSLDTWSTLPGSSLWSTSGPGYVFTDGSAKYQGNYGLVVQQTSNVTDLRYAETIQGFGDVYAMDLSWNLTDAGGIGTEPRPQGLIFLSPTSINERLFFYNLDGIPTVRWYNGSFGTLQPSSYNSWHKLTMIRNGANSKVLFDGVPYNVTPGSSGGTGQIRLAVHWATKQYFDNVRVRKWAGSDPATSFGGEQNQTPPATPVAIASLQPTCSLPTGTITVTSSLVGLYFSIDGLVYSNTSGIFTQVPPGNYNVKAMNSDGCISAPSNSVTLNQPGCAAINGTFKYFNSVTSPLQYVNIKLQQNGVDIYTTAPTSSLGEYSFSNVAPGTYDVVASTSTTSNPIGGINVTDAAQTNYWGVFFGDIEKVRFLAGDVTGNNNIASADASNILQYFLTQGNPTPAFTSEWSFWKTGDQLIPNNPPGPLGYPTITVAGSNVTQNLYGLVTGDFNQSFVPGSTKAVSESLTLIYGETISVIPDMDFDLPLSAVMELEVGAVSLIMNFPSDLLEVNGVFLSDDPNAPLMYSVSGDELRIGWNSLEPVILLEGESLLTLKVKLIGLPGEEGIRFKLAADPLNELADGSYNVINNAVLSIDVITSSMTGTGEISLSDRLTLANHPNPFTGKTTFTYSLPVDGNVTLEIYDIVGNKVKSLVDVTQSAGDYVLSLDEAMLPPGVYTATIKLKNNDTLITRTIKIISKY